MFAPTRGQGRGSNVLRVVRWRVELRNVSRQSEMAGGSVGGGDAARPGVWRKPGDERAYPTMNPLEYFERESLRSCRRKDLGKESMMDGIDSRRRRGDFEGRSGHPAFEIEKFRATDNRRRGERNAMLRGRRGWCEIEKHRLGEYLIPKHKYKVEWKVTTSEFGESERTARGREGNLFRRRVRFRTGGSGDWEEVPERVAKGGARYVKGETQRLGWADEAVERRRKERGGQREGSGS